MKPILLSAFYFFLLSGLIAHADTWSQFDTSTIGEVTALATDGVHIWCATSHGVMRVDTRDNSTSKFHVYNGLNSEEATDISANRSGNVWVAFGDQGVAHFRDGTWTQYYPGDYSYHGEKVWSMFCDSGGGAWVSTYNVIYSTGYPTAVYQPVNRYDGERWTILNTTVTNGVSTEGIQCLAEAADGSFWFGTHPTMNYNGIEWVEYTTVNSGMLSDAAVSIAVDSSNVTWFPSPTSGIASYDGDTWTQYTPENSGLLDKGIIKVAAGSYAGAWILYTSKFEIARFDGDTWINYSGDALNLGDSRISDIVADDTGTLWLGCDTGLYRFDGSVCEKWDGGAMPSIKRINDLFAAPNGDIWMTDVSDYGVYCYHDDTWEYIYVPEEAGFAEGYRHFPSITGDANGMIYYGSDKGIVTFDGMNWRIIIENKVDRSQFYVGKYNVANFFDVDMDGVLWFNNSGGEICSFRDDVFQWYSLFAEYIEYDGTRNVGYAQTTDIFIDHRNNKWFGTSYHGVRKFDHSYGLDETYLYWKKEYYSIGSNISVRRVAVDFNDTVWYSFYDRNENSIPFGLKKIENGVVDDTMYLSVGVTDLAVDKNGVLWIGTFDGVYKHESGVFTHYTVEDGLVDNKVDLIAIGPDNEKWFVSSETGLTRYVDVPPVSVGKADVRPFADIPLSNHPNPFNPSTTIEYTLSEASKVRLTVYSLTGQRVATLTDDFMSAGKHAAVFDGSGLASGLYFYRLEAGNTVKNGRMMLVK